MGKFQTLPIIPAKSRSLYVRNLWNWIPFKKRHALLLIGEVSTEIAGISLGLVGAAFTLDGAGSGVAKLIEVSLNNFGLVFVSSTISFIFWTCVIFPVGGVLVNGGVTLGLVALFGGVPALPGIAVMGAGVFIYYA